LRLALSALVLTAVPFAAAQAPAAAPAARPAPAPLQVPNPHYVTFSLTQDVNASADKVWARVGKFCDIAEWGVPDCKLIQGDGGVGSERTIVNEVLVGKTKYSYTYAQPPRNDAKYNLYHATLEVQPLTASTSKIVYTFLYDNSMLADDAARQTEIDARKKRFAVYLHNMKVLSETGKLAASAHSTPPATPAPTPAQLIVPTPHYVTVPMTLTVNAPVDKVWARIGKYCDIGEWGIPGCTILSGDGNSLGTVRSIGNEVYVGKTQYSYTYTQPLREGATNYTMYHGTLEAAPLTATTTQLNYTLMMDNSMLADDAAKQKSLDNYRTRFTKMLDNMKILAEGGTLPPGAVGAPRPAAPPR
jgi:hypothetical protein